MNYILPLFLILLIGSLSGCSYSYHKTSSAEEIARPSNPLQISKKDDATEQSKQQKAPRKIIIYRVH